jgi:tetratricopeptide (TPR) repeat protein
MELLIILQSAWTEFEGKTLLGRWETFSTLGGGALISICYNRYKKYANLESVHKVASILSEVLQSSKRYDALPINRDSLLFGELEALFSKRKYRGHIYDLLRRGIKQKDGVGVRNAAIDLTLQHKVKKDLELVSLLYYLAAFFSFYDDYAFCRQAAIDALKIRPYDLNLLNLRGLAEFELGDTDAALKTFEKVASFEEDAEVENTRARAVSHGNIGLIYKYRSQPDDAVGCYEKSLEYYEKLGDKHGQAAQNANIGLIFKGTGDVKEAAEHIERALLLFEELGDGRNVVKQQVNMALVLKKDSKLEKAKATLLDAIKSCKKDKLLPELALAQGNLFTVFVEEERWVEALSLGTEVMSLYKQLGNKRFIANSSFLLGRVYLELGRESESLECFSDAVTCYEELKYPEGISKSLIYKVEAALCFDSSRIGKYLIEATELALQYDLKEHLEYVRELATRYPVIKNYLTIEYGENFSI